MMSRVLSHTNCSLLKILPLYWILTETKCTRLHFLCDSPNLHEVTDFCLILGATLCKLSQPDLQAKPKGVTYKL